VSWCQWWANFGGCGSNDCGLNAIPAFGDLDAIAFILIQRLENDILVPAIMGKTIGFNPVIVLVALFAGGKLGGVLGMLIALPVVIVVEEIIKELNKKKQQRLEVAPLP